MHEIGYTNGKAFSHMLLAVCTNYRNSLFGLAIAGRQQKLIADKESGPAQFWLLGASYLMTRL